VTFSWDGERLPGNLSSAYGNCASNWNAGSRSYGQVRGKRPVQRNLAGGFDRHWASRKEFSFLRAPGMAGPGFSLMHIIIFGQQPPKQPPAQNKNGSRFGCLASY
jgi:hypothetical protein